MIQRPQDVVQIVSPRVDRESFDLRGPGGGFDHCIGLQVLVAERTAIVDGLHQRLCVATAVESVRFVDEQFVGTDLIGMDQPVAAAEVAAIRTLINLDPFTHTHGRCHPRQQRGMGFGERRTLRRRMKALLHHIDPGQPSPPAPEVQRARRNAGHGNGGGSDLVRHLLSDEHDFDGCPGAGVLAVKARNGHEEVDAGHLPCGLLETGGETAAAQPGEDGFRRAAHQHHADGGIHRAAALLQQRRPSLGREPMSCCHPWAKFWPWQATCHRNMVALCLCGSGRCHKILERIAQEIAWDWGDTPVMSRSG